MCMKTGLFGRLIGKIAASLQARATIRELHSLGDRELRDIGIHRAEIPEVARGLVARTEELKQAA